MIKDKHNLKGKLANKLYNENVWHVNITKAIVTQFFGHLKSFSFPF